MSRLAKDPLQTTVRSRCLTFVSNSDDRTMGYSHQVVALVWFSFAGLSGFYLDKIRTILLRADRKLFLGGLEEQ